MYYCHIGNLYLGIDLDNFWLSMTSITQDIKLSYPDVNIQFYGLLITNLIYQQIMILLIAPGHKYPAYD